MPPSPLIPSHNYNPHVNPAHKAACPPPPHPTILPHTPLTPNEYQLHLPRILLPFLKADSSTLQMTRLELPYCWPLNLSAVWLPALISCLRSSLSHMADKHDWGIAVDVVLGRVHTGGNTHMRVVGNVGCGQIFLWLMCWRNYWVIYVMIYMQ